MAATFSIFEEFSHKFENIITLSVIITGYNVPTLHLLLATALYIHCTYSQLLYCTYILLTISYYTVRTFYLLSATILYIHVLTLVLVPYLQPWECKLLTSIWMYSRFSNYVWIFVEGFYLYFLIFVNTFSDKSSIKWFLMAGWCKSLNI